MLEIVLSRIVRSRGKGRETDEAGRLRIIYIFIVPPLRKSSWAFSIKKM